MLARLHSMALQGIDAASCEVEVDVSGRGFVGPTIVGLPDTAVRESTHRIKSALVNCGYEFPRSSCVINLAPADLRKEGPAFDLAIAVGLILADGQARSQTAEEFLILGELALDGRVRAVRGALSAGILARQRGLRGLIVPEDNADEAAVVQGIEVIPVRTLGQTIGFLIGALALAPRCVDLPAMLAAAPADELDYGDVRGQDAIKRAMVIAAAGGHNVILVGPPGAGKTMLSRRLPTILPPLTLEESLETTRIYSTAGKLPRGSALLVRRPWRAPHHTASAPALIGGGRVPAAGEVSLAHHGVLFLDEFPEFMRPILETLRQPLEEGHVVIARARGAVEFPSRFMLVAAMNPCPCGHLTDPNKACQCTGHQLDRYLARLSGPLLDRIDMHIEVPAVGYADLRAARPGLSSAAMRRQVAAARRRQTRRLRRSEGRLNATMTGAAVRRWCRLDNACEGLLRQAMMQLGFSARAHDKILKVARTIADLEGAAAIRPEHVTEAIHYRRLDRRF